jgi:hypothetical protein
MSSKTEKGEKGSERRTEKSIVICVLEWVCMFSTYGKTYIVRCHIHVSRTAVKMPLFMFIKLNWPLILLRSRYSNGLDGTGLIPGSARFFSSPQFPDRPWGPPSLLLEPGALSPVGGVKLQGHEADHSPPSSPEVKKVGAMPLVSHMSSWHSA